MSSSPEPGAQPARDRRQPQREIKLPADRIDAFMAAVERHGQANRLPTWQPHTLKPGETLETLAQRGGIAVAELRDANDLRAGQRILPGTRILAPQRAVEDETRVERFDGPRVYELVERPAAYHTVKRHESLATIARRYGTTVANLKAWNGLAKTAAPGTRPTVRPASAQTPLTTEDGGRRVVRSETNEPRIMHAVLRREPAEPERQAAPARTERQHAAKQPGAPAPPRRRRAQRARSRSRRRRRLPNAGTRSGPGRASARRSGRTSGPEGARGLREQGAGRRGRACTFADTVVAFARNSPVRVVNTREVSRAAKPWTFAAHVVVLAAQ